MKRLIEWLMVACLCVSVSACANKGKLKTPSQIEAERIKKEKKAEKAAQEKKAATSPSPHAGEGRGGGHTGENNLGERTPPPNLPPQGGEE